MAKIKLKTLDEHNSKEWSTQVGMLSNQPKANGFACPKCGNELMDSNPNVNLLSYPLQKNVHCDCGYKGYRIV